MYRNLRTNLPREVMSYTDFPFTRAWLDTRRFCSHEEVCFGSHLLSACPAFNLSWGVQRLLSRSCRMSPV